MKIKDKLSKLHFDVKNITEKKLGLLDNVYIRMSRKSGRSGKKYIVFNSKIIFFPDTNTIMEKPKLILKVKQTNDKITEVIKKEHISTQTKKKQVNDDMDGMITLIDICGDVAPTKARKILRDYEKKNNVQLKTHKRWTWNPEEKELINQVKELIK